MVSSVAGRPNVACTSSVLLASAVVYNGLKSYMPTKDLRRSQFVLKIDPPLSTAWQ